MLQDLQRRIAQWALHDEPYLTPIPGLKLFRQDHPTEPVTGLYEPSICVVVQGAKRVTLGDDTFVYDLSLIHI